MWAAMDTVTRFRTITGHSFDVRFGALRVFSRETQQEVSLMHRIPARTASIQLAELARCFASLGRVVALVMTVTMNFVAPARADVKLTERVSVQGTGMMSLANMSGSTVTAISGKNARIDNDMRLESGFARMIARDAGNSTEVVRLQDDVVLEIETKKKRYRESSVSGRRAQLEQASQQLQQAQAKQPMGAALDDSQCEWSSPKSQVKKQAAKESFAGVSAQQTTVVVKQTCKLRNSGAVCEVGIISDLWLANDFSGMTEAQEFRKAYAQQLGLATGSGTLGQQAQSLLGRYPAAWTKLAEELRKVKGQPVKMTFSLEMDGAGCAASAAQEAAGAPTSGQGGDAGANPAAVATQIIGGLFGRKPKAESAADTAATSAPAGSTSTALVILRLSSELTAIDTAALGADTFQAPAGFKKVAAK